MGTFAETTIVSYCLSFADQGKQISVSSKHTKLCRFRFLLEQTIGGYRFPLVLFSVYIYTAISMYINTYIHGKQNYIYILPFQTEKRKHKLKQFS
jgi:hypothetical protein